MLKHDQNVKIFFFAKSMERVPDELLVHILAQLSDPRQLGECALVCRRWRQVLSDETCWRLAFVRHFRSLPYRRLARTWRMEYSLRLNLHRLWQAGKCHNVQFAPQLGPVDKVHVDYAQNRLECGSLQRGMVALCDPTTGRVDRDLVFVAEQREPVAVVCMRLHQGRVLAGMPDGSIVLLENIRNGGSETTRRLLSDRHADAVTCLEVLAGRDGSDHILVSGSRDGSVRMTDLKSGLNLRIFQLSPAVAVTSLVLDKTRNLIIAFSHDANRLFLIGIDQQQQQQTIELHGRLCEKSLSKFFYDSISQCLFVPFGSELHVYDTHTSTKMARLINGHHASISALSWDADIVLLETKYGDIQEHRLCLLVTGDEAGDVCLWDCRRLVEMVVKLRSSTSSEPPSNSNNHQVYTVQPVRILKGHVGPVTCVDVDAFKMTSASLDERLRVWDTLTGQCLRIMNTRYFRHQERPHQANTTMATAAAFEANDRRRVRCMQTTLHQIVIGIGDQIKSWDLDPDRVLSKYKVFTSKKKKARFRSTRRGQQHQHTDRSVTSPRAQRQFDARRDLKESNRILREERQARERRERDEMRERDRRGTALNTEGMTEHDMLRYALMASAAENPTTTTPTTMATSAPTSSARVVPGANFTSSPTVSPRTQSAIAIALQNERDLIALHGHQPTVIPFSENLGSWGHGGDQGGRVVVELDDELAYPPLGSSRSTTPLYQPSHSTLEPTSSSGGTSGGRPVASSSKPIAITASPSKRHSSSMNTMMTTSLATDDGHGSRMAKTQKQSSIGGLSSSATHVHSSVGGGGSSSNNNNKPRKMSLGEFMGSPSGSSLGGSVSTSLPPAFPIGLAMTSSAAPMSAGSSGLTMEMPISQSVTSVGSYRNIWSRQNILSSDDDDDDEANPAVAADNTDPLQDSFTTTDEDVGDDRAPHLSGLIPSTSSSLLSSHHGPGGGSSHSGYRRHTENLMGRSARGSAVDTWASVQVAPRVDVSRDEDEELQYVLELSLVEQ